MDIAVNNGKVVTASDVFEANIGIEGGKIVKISKNNINAEKTINAEGKLVLPGVIDPHVHFQLPFMGTVSIDDFENGTRSGAHGGVTTILDFAIQTKGNSPQGAIEARKAEADPNVCTDYGLHCAITDASPEYVAEIKDIIRDGICSFKLFMTYRKEGFMVEDDTLFAVLQEMEKYGGMAGVHAENPYILETKIEEFVKEGKTDPIYHARSRPNFVEAEAIQRGITLAKAAKAKFYIFHMSTAEGEKLVRKAQFKGLPVFAETCAHYLLRTDEMYEKDDGYLYLMSPPLRSKKDNKGLWNGLLNGSLSLVSTDHCSFTIEQKGGGERPFTEVPNGLMGVETTLPLIYSEGVVKRGMPLTRLVQVLSHNAAQLFGLYPRKGSIIVGGDADLVVLDPKIKKTISHDILHMNPDWNWATGIEVTGWPITTVSKGEVVVEDQQETEAMRPGRGEFIPRKLL